MPLICTKNSFMEAAKSGNLESVETHLQSWFFKPDWLSYLYIGDPALWWAATNGHTAVAQRLIEAGADVNFLSDFSSALAAACSENRMETAAALVESKADINLAGPSGNTPLHYAIQLNISLIEKYMELAEEPGEKWVKLGPDKIARVGVYPEIKRKITEIFNFSSRERIQLSKVLGSEIETPGVAQSFDTIDESILRQALDAFTKQHGVADETFVFQGIRTLKNKLAARI